VLRLGPRNKRHKYPSGYSSAGVGEAARNSRHDWQSRLCEPSDRKMRSHRRHSRRLGFIALRDGFEWALTARAILSSHLQKYDSCFSSCQRPPHSFRGEAYDYRFAKVDEQETHRTRNRTLICRTMQQGLGRFTVFH
jgi:hypothetical protein